MSINGASRLDRRSLTHSARTRVAERRTDGIGRSAWKGFGGRLKLHRVGRVVQPGRSVTAR